MSRIQKVLYDHQKIAVENLKSGMILCGGVGSGKSLTSIAYYILKECGLKDDDYETPASKDLYIITTARKRDECEWEKDLGILYICRDSNVSRNGIKVTIDSWNNIKKYVDVKNAFFIFDEQRLVGSGAWVKSFYKIAKENTWILLSATPGDTWMDYIPVFVANGFYKNRTDFIRQHVIFSPYKKYPQVTGYLNTRKLVAIKGRIVLYMNFKRDVVHHDIDIPVGYDEDLYSITRKTRVNPYTDEPIRNAAEYSQVCRKITNSSEDRISKLKEILSKKPRIIIFYTFDYELDILRKACNDVGIYMAEWNGHKHQELPRTESWAYLVQYTSGCEGWNCIETNAILFYSNNHSYKVMTQAAGRIDRLTSPFKDLWTIHFVSNSSVDKRIKKCLSEKRDFNDRTFMESEIDDDQRINRPAV